MSYIGEGITNLGIQLWDAPNSRWIGRRRTVSQGIVGSGAWDQNSDIIYVSGSGARSITIAPPTSKPFRVTVLDVAGNAATDPITIDASPGLINGAATTVIDVNYGSTTVVLTDETGNGAWSVDSDLDAYLLISGARAMTGNLNMGSNSLTNVNLINGYLDPNSNNVTLGTVGVPSSGYLRVARGGVASFDLLATVLNDGTTLREIIQLTTDNVDLKTTTASPLRIVGAATAAPLVFSTASNTVQARIEGGSADTWVIGSGDPSTVLLHKYGPQALTGALGLNLRYRPTPVTTVLGLGVDNTSDTTKMAVRGLNTDNSTLILDGQNSSGSTVFSVTDGGRTTVATATAGGHAINQDYLTPVVASTTTAMTITDPARGRTHIQFVDTSSGSWSDAAIITLPLNSNTGTRIVIKDIGGQGGSKRITVSGNTRTIDGASSYIIGANYGSVTLVSINGTSWAIL